MRHVCFLLAAAVVLQMAGAIAQEKNEGPTVFVPYDDLEKVLAEPKPRVLLSLEEYRKLREAALRPAKKPPVEAALLEAHYTGAVQGDAARLSGRFVIQCISRDAVRLALPMQGLSVASVSGAAGGMLVGPAESGVEVILTEAGRYELELDLVGRVVREAGRARLRVGLPAAAPSWTSTSAQACAPMRCPPPPREQISSSPRGVADDCGSPGARASRSRERSAS